MNITQMQKDLEVTNYFLFKYNIRYSEMSEDSEFLIPN
jgi:hypothetical protein